ncbi:MAG TPA: DUF4091 domain-containing protein [Clostridiales bacterium]|nr:DUF4091 domain-containing protein [Clostridiales bacterium]
MFTVPNLKLKINKIIGSILVAILSVGYYLGLSFDIQGVRYDKSSVLTYCFYDSTYKLGKNEFIGKNETYNIHLAKNEYEACQIAVRSKMNSTHRKYTIEFSQFVNENGDVLPSEVFEEKYIACVSDKNYGTFPDALVKYAPAPFSLSPQQNKVFYIQVHAGKDTPAGTYKATITARSSGHDNDKVQFIAEVTATVWNFELPDTPSCETAFGLSKYNIVNAYYANNDPERAQALYEQYYEYLVNRKISPYNLPVDILSDEADAYMSDPRVTSFIIPYYSDDATLVAAYNKVQSNPEWAKKGYFYPIDEPSSLEDYGRYNAIVERLDRLCPGFKMVTPFYQASIKEGGKTYHATELQSASKIVCPLTSCFNNKTFLEQIDKRRADGSKMWWYVCCSPQGSYCNIFTHWEGIKGRLLLWQQKQFNVQGLLYWDTTYWKDVVSPWGDALTTPWTGNDTFGDGSLLYPGQDGPVASLRLEEIADGIEDYEYLTIAEELFGRDYINNKIAKVTNTLTDYTLDDSLLAKVRVEIGNDINNAMSGN